MDKKLLIIAGAGLVGVGYLAYRYLSSPMYVFNKWVDNGNLRQRYPYYWKWEFWEDYLYHHPEIWAPWGDDTFRSYIVVYTNPEVVNAIAIDIVDVNVKTSSVIITTKPPQ